MIYADNSATTKLDEEVFSAMLPWLRDEYGNASSVYSIGRKARVAIESAREELAHLINAHPAEVIFTSGGTESNNTILKSCTGESSLADCVLTSSIEHHAVLYPAEELHRTGTQHIILPVDEQGILDAEQANAILEQTVLSNRTKDILVSLMHANNETGAIQPIRQLRDTMNQVCGGANRGYLHTDAVQSFGKIRFDVQELGCDFATLSAHKIHGPKGVGAMFIRKGIDFKSHQQGGGQERNRRAGTEPVALIVGFQVSARKAIAELNKRAEHTRALVNELRTMILARIPNVRINTPLDESLSLPTILNISFTDAKNLDGEAILQMMDMNGIACSNGSACVSGTPQPSHVLSAMGLPIHEAKAAVRFSFSQYNSSNDVHTIVSALERVMTGLRG
jgi:cysteine desulfurase